MPIDNFPINSMPLSVSPIDNLPIDDFDLVASGFGALSLRGSGDRLAAPLDPGRGLRQPGRRPERDDRGHARRRLRGRARQGDGAPVAPRRLARRLHARRPALHGDPPLTVGDLLDGLPTPSGLTFNDLLALFITRSGVAWETLSADVLGSFGDNGGLGWRAAFTLEGSEGGVGEATVAVTLPAGWRYARAPSLRRGTRRRR